jgi:hypothetical protein
LNRASIGNPFRGQARAQQKITANAIVPSLAGDDGVANRDRVLRIRLKMHMLVCMDRKYAELLADFHKPLRDYR